MEWFNLKTFLLVTVVFVVVDLIWLGVLMGRVYSEQLGFLGEVRDGKVQFKMAVGLITQIIIGAGLALVLMRIGPNNLVESVFWGGLLGFVIYATYDLTSLSFVKNWPISITIIDILWGVFQGMLAGFGVWLF